MRQKVSKKGSQASLDEAISRWFKYRGDHRLPVLEHFRDKFLAHWSKPDLDIPKPLIGDIYNFARETAETMEELAHGTGVTDDTLACQIKDFTESATNFWAPWVQRNAQNVVS